MGQSFSSHHDRQQLELALHQRLRSAQVAYRAAAAQHLEIRTRYENMLDHPDGTHALHQAVMKEHLALQEYARALKAFSDLILHNRPPEPGPES